MNSPASQGEPNSIRAFTAALGSQKATELGTKRIGRLIGCDTVNSGNFAPMAQLPATTLRALAEIAPAPDKPSKKRAKPEVPMITDPVTGETAPASVLTDYDYAVYNAPHVFSVTKRSDETTYLVDLEKGIGACGCDDYHYRRDPTSKSATLPFTSCKHMIGVRCMRAAGQL